MTVALLTLHLLALAALAATVVYGDAIPGGHGALGRHLTAGLVATLLAVFAHTMTYFYFVGMGSSLRRTVEETGRGSERLAESRRLKARVFPFAALAMLAVMTAFVLGGGAHTRAFPSWIHTATGYAAVGLCGVAFLVETRYLLEQNRVINAFQRELAAGEGPGASA